MERKLLILDRNIISLMNKHNNGSNIPDLKSKNKLQELLSMDKGDSIFTSLFAIIEGKIQKVKLESGVVEILKTPHRKIRKLIKEESSIVKDFVSNATTDYDFLNQNEKKIAKILYEKEHDGFLDDKIRFLGELKDDISVIKPVEDRKKEYKKFKTICEKYNQFKNQPFTLISLMYIFNSSRSAKLLKFSRNDFVAYNTIADFNHIRNLHDLMYNYHVNGKLEMTIISLDSDINFINEIIKFNNGSLQNLTNFSNYLKLNWRPNPDAIDFEIKKTKDDSNKIYFYECFKDFYGYDLRDFIK